MSKSTISVFLPVFFSALVICGVVLCTCAYCHRPSFLFFRRGPAAAVRYGGRRRRHGSSSSSSDDDDDDDMYSDSTIDEEKPRPPPRVHRGRETSHRHNRRVISTRRENVSQPSGPPPNPESIEVIQADPVVEEINVVEAEPEID